MRGGVAVVVMHVVENANHEATRVLETSGLPQVRPDQTQCPTH